MAGAPTLGLVFSFFFAKNCFSSMPRKQMQWPDKESVITSQILPFVPYSFLKFSGCFHVAYQIDILPMAPS